MDILYHAILTMFEGKAFFAPVENPQRIVDSRWSGSQLFLFRACLLLSGARHQNPLNRQKLTRRLSQWAQEQEFGLVYISFYRRVQILTKKQAMDVGDEYPEAHVIGIDLSPIQPKWTCPNVEFRVDDLEQPWVFDSPLDLVHSRGCSGLAIRDWPKYLAQAYKSLRPG